jgi:antitoxin component YwqK of YwqJK toxin-antitoxin module
MYKYTAKFIGYKSAFLKETFEEDSLAEDYLLENKQKTRVIVTLLIPFNAKTNSERKNIFNPLYAKYRTNSAKVINIEDENGKKYNEAYTAFYEDKILYKLNENVKSEFDYNIDVVCGKGIHFFLNKSIAYNYGRKLFGQKWEEPNLYQTFYNNGHIREKTNYIYDVNFGFIKKNVQLWFENGNKWKVESYQHELKNGLFSEWYKDATLKYECFYVNGYKNGFERFYYYNGQRKLYIHYKNGVMNGRCNLWYFNGKVNIECEFYNDILCDNYKKWNKFGKLINENNDNIYNEINETIISSA